MKKHNSLYFAIFSIFIISVVCIHLSFVSAIDSPVKGVPVEGSPGTNKVYMELGDLYQFSLDGKMYNIIVWGMKDDQYVGIRINPTLYRVELNKSTTTLFDLDGNGVDDYQVEVPSIIKMKAELLVTDMAVAAAAPKPEPTPEPVVETPASVAPIPEPVVETPAPVVEENSSKTWYYVIAAIVIAAAAYYFLVIRKKHSFPQPHHRHH